MADAHQAMLGGSQSEMMAAALSLSGDKSLAALGLQALLWAEVEQPEKALAIPVPGSKAYNSSEANGGYWLHYGRYIAFTHRRDYVRAAMELGEAKVYVRLLGDERRLQLLDCEMQEVAVQLGVAVPEEIEAELTEEMNPTRRAWHHADHYVASRMQLGEYRKCAELAPATHGFCYLNRALTGQALEMSAADGLQFEVARAWGEVWSGRPAVHVKGHQSDVVQTYGDLAYAVTLASDTATAWHVPAILGTVPPRRADQAAIWAAVQIQAAIRGAQPDHLLSLPRIFNEALARLRDTADVMALLNRLTPEAIVVISCGPRPHPDTLAASIVFSRATEACPLEFLKAGLMRKPWPAVPGRRPNYGAMLYGVKRMIDTAEDEQRSQSEQLWRVSMQDLWGYCPAHFRSFVLQSRDHCISDWTMPTLEA